MDLFILRHGEAGKSLAVPLRDRERALTQAGKEEVQAIGEALAKRTPGFDVVASSPLKRARETANIVNKTLRRKLEVEEWPELSPEGNRELFYKRLAKMKADAVVLVVGHEPYLTIAVAEMSGKGGAGSMRILLKKGGVVKLRVTGSNPKGGGELRWLLTPKLLKKLA